MKKKLNEIFDEISPSELEPFGENLSAPKLEDNELATIKNKVYAKLEINGTKKIKRSSARLWLRVGIIAACMAVAIVSLFLMLILKDNDGTDVPDPDGNENTVQTPDGSTALPVVNPQIPSLAPIYYGSEYSTSQTSTYGDVATYGFSLAVEFVEALPDTYTFFEDWNQREYRLLRMRTLNTYIGEKMFREFYYVMPIEFMTDFSRYDRFVILDLSQKSYEHSVLYNKTQGKAEQLTLALFESMLGSDFFAFDGDGNFDRGLWQANEAWKKLTDNEYSVNFSDTFEEIEEKMQERSEEFGYSLYAHSLSGISGEAAETLEYIKSFENGIFVPISSRVHALSPEVQFHATRYINGFATNETVSVWDKDWNGGDKDTYTFSKARFDAEDLKSLPNLRGAITTVADAYDKGEVNPPHTEDYENLNFVIHGIFGWYAKTDDGVIGVVRVSWKYDLRDEDIITRYDDAYYVIEYGSEVCKPIERDALLERLGECESSYIYKGDYTQGKGAGIIIYG